MIWNTVTTIQKNNTFTRKTYSYEDKNDIFLLIYRKNEEKICHIFRFDRVFNLKEESWRQAEKEDRGRMNGWEGEGRRRHALVFFQPNKISTATLGRRENPFSGQGSAYIANVPRETRIRLSPLSFSFFLPSSPSFEIVYRIKTDPVDRIYLAPCSPQLNLEPLEFRDLGDAYVKERIVFRIFTTISSFFLAFFFLH